MEKLTLSSADRERLAAPEQLDVTMRPLSVEEAEAIEEATGLAFGEFMALVLPRIDPVPDKPHLQQWHYPPKGVKVLVWIGLRRAGIETEFATLTFDVSGFAGVQSAPEPEPVGKAPRSRSGARAMKSTSPTSGRRTPSKRSAS